MGVGYARVEFNLREQVYKSLSHEDSQKERLNRVALLAFNSAVGSHGNAQVFTKRVDAVL